jgi:hypothetical protein
MNFFGLAHLFRSSKRRFARREIAGVNSGSHNQEFGVEKIKEMDFVYSRTAKYQPCKGMRQRIVREKMRLHTEALWTLLSISTRSAP